MKPKTQLMNNKPSNILGSLTKAALFSLLIGTTYGCVYKVDVQQGNIIDPTKQENLKIGMSQKQVSQLLGTPMLADPFHTDRWDYYTWSKTGRKERISKKQMSLIFNDGLLTEIN